MAVAVECGKGANTGPLTQHANVSAYVSTTYVSPGSVTTNVCNSPGESVARCFRRRDDGGGGGGDDTQRQQAGNDGHGDITLNFHVVSIVNLSKRM